jgi:hypothetical protein
LLLLKRRGQAAGTFHHMNEERQSLLDAWRRKLQGLEDQGFVELNRNMERTTFEMSKGPIIGMELAGLRKILNASQDILVKVIAASLHCSLRQRRQLFLTSSLHRLTTPSTPSFGNIWLSSFSFSPLGRSKRFWKECSKSRSRPCASGAYGRRRFMLTSTRSRPGDGKP